MSNKNKSLVTQKRGYPLTLQQLVLFSCWTSEGPAESRSVMQVLRMVVQHELKNKFLISPLFFGVFFFFFFFFFNISHSLFHSDNVLVRRQRQSKKERSLSIYHFLSLEDSIAEYRIFFPFGVVLLDRIDFPSFRTTLVPISPFFPEIKGT